MTEKRGRCLFERLEGPRQDLEGLRVRAHAALVHGNDPLLTASGTASPPTSCPSANSKRTPLLERCPNFSFIEPDMASGHNDYHPALSRSMIGNNEDFGFDPPSSMLGGEAFLQRGL